ncbi:MAG: sulfotransferase [Bacteroidia bacterium]|nr:sulfotransferase [Bacteroidia bacterium]
MGMLKFVYDAYNNYTLRKIEREFEPFRMCNKKQHAPLLVSGAFRSGTSLVTRILSEAGYDIGPQSHLLQATGKYKQFNPDGYYENYFFMELSRYLFHITGSNGDAPPEEGKINLINRDLINDKEFRKYAILRLRESRVSNLNKAKVLSCASVEHCKAYVNNVYGKDPVIKNPHFSVLLPWIENIFPDSIHVVVFRHPSDWKVSALNVTAKANEQLYDAYYIGHLQSHRISNRVFVNYDRLVESPEESIAQILDKLNSPSDRSRTLHALVKKRTAQKQQSEASKSETYARLLSLAVNK